MIYSDFLRLHARLLYLQIQTLKVFKVKYINFVLSKLPQEMEKIFDPCMVSVCKITHFEIFTNFESFNFEVT